MDKELFCSKAKKNLGWFPKWDIHNAVRKIIEWEKAVEKGESEAKVTDKQIMEYFG